MLDFLGIGAQKSGTTWLYEMLARHPHIRFPAGGKEVHFWDMFQARGLAWYQSLFADEAPGCVQGEITPAYAILPAAEIAKIHRYFPQLRLIYLIRNPLERAWSSALMALERAEMTFDEASDQWFIDHFRSQGSLRRGDYAQCLRHWHRVYPPQQLAIFRFEQIQADPRGLLMACCRHFEVAADFYAQVPAADLRRQVFGGSGRPLRPTLKPVLAEIYADKIRDLETYLQEDFSIWLNSP